MAISKHEGVVMTPIQSYTTTLSDETNITKVAKYFRLGQHLFIDIGLIWTGAGAGGGAFTVSIPSGFTIVTANLVGGASTDNNLATNLGIAEWFDAGVAWKVLTPWFVTTTTIGFHTNTGVQLGTDFASGDGLKAILRVPIA